MKAPVYLSGEIVEDLISKYSRNGMNQEAQQGRDMLLIQNEASVKNIIIEAELSINQSIYEKLYSLIKNDFSVKFSLIPKIPEGE